MNATEKAEHALRQSFEEERTQIAMTEGSRLVLQGILRQELPAAIADGIQAAMTPAAAAGFADALINAMQARATQTVNQAAGGLVRQAIKKVAFFSIAGLIVYGAGGWAGLAAVLNWLKPGWLK